MSVITDIYLTESVAIISFENSPAHISFVADLFKAVADNGINIDMISQTAPKGGCNTISFTVPDDRLAEVLSAVKAIKSIEMHKADILPLVSPGNVKISLYGKEMPNFHGVAAGVFSILNNSEIDALLITTSDVDISIVISAVNADKAYMALKKEYIK